MTIASLIIAIISLGVAYLALHKGNALEQRLSTAEKDLSLVKAELGAAKARLEARTDEANLDARRQSGALKFLPSMTIAEAMQVHPGVADVLANYKLSGCSSCAISDVDTLEGACRSYGVDETALMSALAKLVENNPTDLLHMARTMPRSTRN